MINKPLENKCFILDEMSINKRGIKTFIKRMLYYPLSFIYKCILFLYRPKKQDKKYKVSICSIFKNEGLYLKEWIEYHLIVGVEHFYLYNNNSDDNYLEILKPYIDSGVVTLTDWEFTPGQMKAFADCADKHKNDTEWIAYIDLDEFIVPKKDYYVYDFLRHFKNRPFVLAYWKIFASGGLKARKSDYVIEDFVISPRKLTSIGKCFYNTKYNYSPELKENSTMHLMSSKVCGIEIPPINSFGKFVIYNINKGKNKETIQINHYLTKSIDEYLYKKSKRGGGVHVTGFHTMGYFLEHNYMCDSVDYSTYRYLPHLKLKVDYKLKDE